MAKILENLNTTILAGAVLALIALLVFTFFRLDQVFANRKKGSPASRHPTQVPPKRGSLLGTDPDGRAWDDPPSSKK